jgi:hypothetical protein
LNRIRWLILILGPVPIVGSSWALSAWLKSEPRAVVMHNSILPARAGERAGSAVFSHPLADAPRALDGECEQMAGRLRAALGPECQVIVRAPFVVAGDLTVDELEELYDDTIAPAVRAMRASYFDAEIGQAVTVLVFDGEKSYNRYCEELFGEREISIYGYYKPQRRTLVMNIATGKGTLLHELTHALAAFDFPDLPDWLNEGLASLHEQSRFRADSKGPWIEGLVNWRLAGLKEVARRDELRPLAELVADTRFRGPDEGTNYAQARYFCLYMQQKGVLEKFYRAFRNHRSDDPRGLKTLGEIFTGVEWKDLDKDFARWVLALESPR